VQEQIATADLGRIHAQANGCIINICASGEDESPAMQWAIQDIPFDSTTLERGSLMWTNITHGVDSPIDIQYQYLFVVVDFYDASRT
jgi:hypothetical protein